MVRGRTLRSDITWLTAVVVGLAQLLAAVFPGTSRSAATILIALALGWAAPAATEFSFLVGVPTLLAAGLYETQHALSAPGSGGHGLGPARPRHYRLGGDRVSRGALAHPVVQTTTSRRSAGTASPLEWPCSPASSEAKRKAKTIEGDPAWPCMTFRGGGWRQCRAVRRLGGREKRGRRCSWWRRRRVSAGGQLVFTAAASASRIRGLRGSTRDILPDHLRGRGSGHRRPAYTENQFYDDLMRVTEGRSDIDMAEFSSSARAHHRLDEEAGSPLDSDVRAPVLSGRGQAPLLGRPERGGGWGRRRPRGDAPRARGQGGHRGALRPWRRGLT